MWRTGFVALLLMGCGATSGRGPAGVALPAPEPAAPTLAAEPLPAPSLRFASRGKLERAATAFPIEGALYLAVHGWTAQRIELDHVDAASSRITPVAQVETVVASAPSVVALFGRHPEVQLVHVERGGPLPSLFHHRIARGHAENRGTRLGELCGVATRGGSRVALVCPPGVARMSMATTVWTLEGEDVPLEFEPAHGCTPERGFEKEQLLVHDGFGSGSDGALVAYGFRCGREPALEVWPSGSARSTIVSLPKPHLVDGYGPTPSLVASAGGATVVVGDAIWRSEDGRRYSVIDWPAGEGTESAALSQDDVLWVVADGGLYAHARGAWQRIELPVQRVEQVAAGPDGQLWAVGDEQLFARE